MVQWKVMQRISIHSLTRRLTVHSTIDLFLIYISIHSLTRRLTSHLCMGIWLERISIHSLTRRLTPWFLAFVFPPKDFNSQPHKEADKTIRLPCVCNIISIHSLTRRLTADLRGGFFLHEHFNSQPHKEADVREPDSNNDRWTFQFTASQGGWPRRILITRITGVFQFTASQGGWRRIHSPCQTWLYFNSQPHKEADCSQPEGKRSSRYISIHSLTRRLTVQSHPGE